MYLPTSLLTHEATYSLAPTHYVYYPLPAAIHINSLLIYLLHYLIFNLRRVMQFDDTHNVNLVLLSLLLLCLLLLIPQPFGPNSLLGADRPLRPSSASAASPTPASFALMKPVP